MNDMPPLMEQAVNLFKATVQHIVSGRQPASDEQVATRMALCLACPEYKEDSQRCRECGCKLKRKTRWLKSKCPLGKW